MIDYSEQIKSPKWQRKRLEILTRDNFECTACGATDKPLHVHHKKYIAGRDYWDYPDELLVTLCEDCHRKLHGKEELEKIPNPPRPVLHKPKPRSSQMKIVFYKELLDKRNYPDMNYNERIVYSFLVSKSVVCDGQYLDKESGCLNKDWLNADIEESGFIPMANYSYRKIATLLHLTLQAIFNIIHSLKDKGYIGTTEIRLNKCLIESGYFELIFKPGLRGKMLITYSYFKEKASYFNGVLDTYKSKLAQELGVDVEVLKKTLTNLYKLGLIKRLKDNKLQIL